jgi:hypothetical protein
MKWLPLPKITIRGFAVVFVIFTSGYVMWLGNKINDTLSGPGWCATALGAGKVTGQTPIAGLSSCVDLLKIQLSSLSINSHILLGTIALCIAVLVIIVLAGATFSGEVDGHGAKMNLAPSDKNGSIPVKVTEPVQVTPAQEEEPSQ